MAAQLSLRGFRLFVFFAVANSQASENEEIVIEKTMINQKTTKLISVPHEYEAELVASALRDAGIESQVVGGVMADFRAECPGMVDVIVNEDDVLIATEIVQRLDESADNIDWDTVDVGEPESSGEPLAEDFNEDADDERLPQRSFVVISVVMLSVLYFVANALIYLLQR